MDAGAIDGRGVSRKPMPAAWRPQPRAGLRGVRALLQLPGLLAPLPLRVLQVRWWRALPPVAVASRAGSPQQSTQQIPQLGLPTYPLSHVSAFAPNCHRPSLLCGNVFNHGCTELSVFESITIHVFCHGKFKKAVFLSKPILTEAINSTTIPYMLRCMLRVPANMRGGNDGWRGPKIGINGGVHDHSREGRGCRQ